MGAKVHYLTIAEVAKKVLQRDKDYLVIDVRSSDFPGGNLPRAVNITSREFENDASIQRVIDQQITPLQPTLRTVITHCMRSQMRGPYAAQQLQSHPNWPPDVGVYCMRGGYQSWLREFRGQLEYFENLDEQSGWEDEERIEGMGVGKDEEAHSREIREKRGKE
ncbi:hypothetical protein MNV49_000215 [Pseudohyphozyma bogoriensis]|nr:hypothetical protein MNV49_000215 [Pseudohyphozyma bogoriensis]